MLWDSSYTIINKALKDMLSTDNISYSSNLSDSPALPSPRAETSIALFGNPTVYLVIFGGHTVVDEIYSYLDDMWTFSLYSERWTQVLPNNLIPPKRSGHTLFVTH